MASEREIKLKIDNEKALKKGLGRLGAKPVSRGSGRVHEWNVIFDTPQGGLAKHGQLLRIRKETAVDKKKREPRILLTFKKPAVAAEDEGHGHKVREEIETEVKNGV